MFCNQLSSSARSCEGSVSYRPSGTATLTSNEVDQGFTPTPPLFSSHTYRSIVYHYPPLPPSPLWFNNYLSHREFLGQFSCSVSHECSHFVLLNSQCIHYLSAIHSISIRLTVLLPYLEAETGPPPLPPPRPILDTVHTLFINVRTVFLQIKYWPFNLLQQITID